MSKLRDKVEKAAEIVGGPGIHAKRFGGQLLHAFDTDNGNPDSVFNLAEGETIEDRMALVGILEVMPGADKVKARYIHAWFVLYAYSCAVAKGREDLRGRRDELADELSSIEGAFDDDTAEEFPVEVAAKASIWG